MNKVFYVLLGFGLILSGCGSEKQEEAAIETQTEVETTSQTDAAIEDDATSVEEVEEQILVDVQLLVHRLRSLT